MHNGLKIVGGSLFAAWMALNPVYALAQEKNEGPVSIPKSNDSWQNETWVAAGNFAKENPAIGIAIYGRTTDASGEQIGQYMQSVFQKYGINSQYFLSKPDKNGVTVGFYLKGVQYGPTLLSEANGNLKTIIKDFPAAWPDFQTPRENSMQQLGHEK